jgi:hypothetical protein
VALAVEKTLPAVAGAVDQVVARLKEVAGSST